MARTNSQRGGAATTYQHNPPGRDERDRCGPVTLLVASGGGHLAELHALADRLVRPDETAVWVTEDTPQAHSLLAGERVRFTPPLQPRDYRALATNTAGAWQLFRAAPVRRVISTGAGIALAYLPIARALGIPAYFVESAARLEGPSLTGKLLSGVPGVARYTQAASWASGRWRYGGTVFDGFSPRPPAAGPLGSACPAAIRRVVVTVGTLANYPFDRLVHRVSDLVRLLPPGVEVTWQLGPATVLPAPPTGQGSAQRFLGWRELQRRIADADVVIAHAGVGSALDALRAGKLPVLVPRRRAFGEHVDDHQAQIADELAARGLALVVEADAVSLDHLELAAAAAVDRATAVPPLLVGSSAQLSASSARASHASSAAASSALTSASAVPARASSVTSPA